ncbi:hypothetical protein NUW58_g4897 [Xylaria curta]|uniref:Uncharacterized protein n=1 Tax=Xylaria curta TaxID=42375 RepID=A0ACC1P4U3_9PEZI|nr:hypothetical protein NUW58_g4897 [Xylaria curta]
MNSLTASFTPDSSGTSPKQSEYIPHLKVNDGYEIPLLAYGLGTTRSGEDAEKVIDLTVKAIKNGYYHLDGAQSYKNETELGIAIKKSGVDRAKLFVTTKLQNVNCDVPTTFAKSLTRLGLSYVDLYLIHAPFSAKSPEQLQKTWADLEAIQASGRGAARVTPAVNQIEYHPYLHQASDELLDFCRERKIAVAAYGPLTAVTKARPGPCDDVYAALASKYGVPEGDIALRWCIDQGIVAITTSGSEQRLQGYMNRLPAFKLTPKEIETLAEEGNKKHFRGFWTQNYAADDSRLRN